MNEPSCLNSPFLVLDEEIWAAVAFRTITGSFTPLPGIVISVCREGCHSMFESRFHNMPRRRTIVESTHAWRLPTPPPLPTEKHTT